MRHDRSSSIRAARPASSPMLKGSRSWSTASTTAGAWKTSGSTSSGPRALSALVFRSDVRPGPAGDILRGAAPESEGGNALAKLEERHGENLPRPLVPPTLRGVHHLA